MTYKPDSLQLHGIYATCASHALTATVAQEATQGWGDVQWLVVSVFHAQPQPMVRQLLRRVRRRSPHTQIILALWNAGPDVLTEESLARMGAASVVTSLQELLLRMQQLVSPEQGQQGYSQTAMPNACKPCSAAGCFLPVCCLRTRKRCSRQPMPFM